MGTSWISRNEGNLRKGGYDPLYQICVGLGFGAHFVHDFSRKMFLFNTLSMGKVSMSYLFFFPRYHTKFGIKSFKTVDDVTNYNICTGSISKAMTDREKNGARLKY